MKHLLFIFTLLMSVTVSPLIFAWQEVPETQQPTHQSVPFVLYRQIADAKKQDENLFFSPSSISLLMSALSLGADHEAATEIQKSFGFANNKMMLDTMKRTLASASGNFIISNSFWYQNDWRVNPAYQQKLDNLFGTKIQGTDFAKDAQGATKQINAWIEKSTDEMIKDFFKDGQIHGLTRFVAVNALLFKGKWDSAFEKENTREKPFYGKNESKVQMMYKTAKFSYHETNTYQSIKLPYKDSFLEMLVFLPKPSTMFESLIDDNILNAFDKDNRMVEVAISLPKFETETDIDFIPILKNLGVNKVFSDGFEPMFNVKELGLTVVQQKAKVQVDEEGTAAVAVSGAVGGLRSLPVHVKKIEFTADHPFLYLIRDSKTGIVHFVGHFVKGK
ncbi:MAG: serpin family protein [Planctomycetaceae bacterium]|jgi:serpin B|nr:serpin family protein [Planctomycetaceae bacterium]